MIGRLAQLVATVREAAERRGAVAGDPLDAVVTVLEAEYDGAPGPPHLDRVAGLASVFGLDALDEQLLTVAAAGELDANLALALGLLSGDSGPAWPSVATALELGDAPTLDPDVRARLHRLAPLRYHGLLEVVGDGPALGHRLRVPERVVGHLLGDDTPDHRLAPLLTQVVPVDAPAAERLALAVERGVRLTWVRTPSGAAGAGVAARGVERAGLTPLVVDLTQAVVRDQLADVVTAATLEAGLDSHGLVLLGAEALSPREGPSLVHLLETAVGPVVCVADRTWDVRWSARVPFLVDAPRLSGEALTEVWGSALAAGSLDPERPAPEPDHADPAWQDLLSLRLTPEEVLRVTRDATLAAAVDDRAPAVTDLRTAARHLGTSGDLAVERTSAGFDDLVLPEAALGELRRLVSWVRHRDEVLSQGPLQGAGGKGTGIAALFGGSPGTGKTLAAHVIANELGLDLYPVDLSSVVDKYIGETEKNLERVFREAESMNVVLFFDEADSIFGSRSAVSDSKDRYANLEVSYLLQRMEHFDGVTILATNLRGNLDAAFTRRLQFMLTFPDPDAPTRRRIWERLLSHLAALDPDDPPDVDVLAGDLELAGGDIRNVVLAAAYDAADRDGGVLGMRHLATAAAREFAKLRRRPPPSLARWSGRTATGGSAQS